MKWNPVMGAMGRFRTVLVASASRANGGPMIWLRKLAVGTVGGLLLLVGVAMILLPGPAVVVIPAALAILAVEFVWARRFLTLVRERVGALAKVRPRKG